MQLRLLLPLVIALAPRAARADGEVTVRTQYYKERSTRVAQPMVDARIVLGDMEVRGHALVDAITSASPASGATGQPFTEYRWEVGAGATHGFGRWKGGGDLRFSHEPDYQSLFAVVRGEVDFANRNTTLGLTAGAGRDALSNAGAQGGMSQRISGELATWLGSVSVRQVLSRFVIAGVSYDLAYLEGFQENPYRTVAAGGMIEMERLPGKRYRHAVAGSVRGILPESRSTAVVSYRLYTDSWGIIAHSPELRLIQDLRRDLDLHLRWRYHRQDRADFFRAIYDTSDPAVEPFLTDDVKLSAYDTHTIGVKLEAPLQAIGLRSAQTAAVRVDLVLEYVIQHNRYGNAIVGGLGLTVPMNR